MKLKFLIFVTFLAAMGPARDAPPPDPDGVRDTASQNRPARLPPVDASPAPEATVAVTAPVLNASDTTPDQFLWTARPVVIFADTPNDPAFIEQVETLRRDPRALAGRDVVIIVDSDPAANSVWRDRLRPSGFSLLLIDKDGQVKIRRPSPWDAREIGRAIDRLPLRRQEIGRGSLLR